MKRHKRSRPNAPKLRRRARRRPTARPRRVYLAIRRLLDATNHIRARAAELENALEALREEERARAIAELLQALRNSPDGDLLRSDPIAPGESGTPLSHPIVGALVEAFSIRPIRTVGERMAIHNGKIPDTSELDRPIGDEQEKCIAADVVSVGWSYKHHLLLKPVVRPVLPASSPVCSPEGQPAGNEPRTT